MEAKFPSVPLLLNETDADAYSGINLYQLRAFRRQRIGPVVVKIGRSVRYRPEDLDAYVQENRVAPSDLPPVEHRVARAATGGARRR